MFQGTRPALCHSIALSTASGIYSLTKSQQDLNSQTHPCGNGEKMRKHYCCETEIPHGNEYQADLMDEEEDCGTIVEHNTKTSHLSDSVSVKCFYPQVPPFCLLSVHIIRIRNLQKADTLSQSDCYVSLKLPTASSDEFRTKTISNASNPVWNETFFFRIQPMAKNILELKVYDEDNLFRDDYLCSILFDIAHVQPGETVCKHFDLNEQKEELLEVEFTLEQMADTPEDLATNGVLLARQLCCLKAEVDGRKWKKRKGKHHLTFTVKGSFEDMQNVVLKARTRNVAIEFHYPKYCCEQIEVELGKKCSFCHLSCRRIREPIKLPLLHLPVGQTVEIADKKQYDIFVTADNRQKDLDIRLGFDLSPEEQDFICKRKKYIAAALKNVLQLGEDLQDDEIPVVAVMTTAGGIRSMTAMLGSLLGLQKLNLLDCISYITGLSGTTWTMIKLYGDAYWSQKDLKGPVNEIRKHAMKNKLCCFSAEHLKYYEKEIWQRHLEGYKLSFTDLWGLILESMFHDEPDPNKLSDQRQAVNMGQNPLPIYVALNVKERYSTTDFKEWVEFTPYEVGFLKYGGFIKAEDFGSEFFMGRVMKKIPESRLTFMQGMWSNIYSQNVLDALYLADCPDDFWHRWTRNRIVDIEEESPCSLPTRPYVQPTRLFVPSGTLTDILRDVVTARPVLAHFHNFMKGLQLNDKYLENDRFHLWKDTVIDSSPNLLSETAEYLELVDTAFFINTSCPPLLRPERKVDVILHLNYSGGLQTLPLDLSVKYYKEQGIPFPKVELTEKDREHLKECYVFDEAEMPKAPILVYMPLVCDTFQKYKAPGVERSHDEKEEGQLDVSSSIFTPYATGMLQYSEENFNKLVNLTNYNILNNEHLILRALRTAVERKKQQKSSFHSS